MTIKPPISALAEADFVCGPTSDVSLPVSAKPFGAAIVKIKLADRQEDGALPPAAEYQAWLP